MNKITFLILGFLVFVFALSQSACRRCDDPTNPDCCNYDPCTRKANAEFVIESKLKDKWIEGDTIMGFARFRALHEADSFVWILGLDTFKNVKEPFYQYFPSGVQTAKYIAYRTPQKDCDPNDDGIDTLIKYFWVMPSNPWVEGTVLNPAYILGTYYGHLESNPAHDYYIYLTVDSLVLLNGSFIGGIQVIKNIPKEGENSSIKCRECDLFTAITPFNCYVEWSYLSLIPTKGYAELTKESGRKNIRFEYSYLGTATQIWKNEVYVGRKLE